MDVDRSELLAILRRTPDVLDSMLAGLPAQWIIGAEGPDTWSPYQIVGHLIHGEKTDWIPRTHRILEHGKNLAFEPFDRTAMLRLSQDRPLAELLAEFRKLRAENLARLDALVTKEDQLSLQGLHPDLGTVTLRQLLATWVVHDLAHLSQIARVMAKQYTEAVGPWRAYFTTLK